MTGGTGTGNGNGIVRLETIKCMLPLDGPHCVYATCTLAKLARQICTLGPIRIHIRPFHSVRHVVSVLDNLLCKLLINFMTGTPAPLDIPKHFELSISCGGQNTPIPICQRQIDSKCNF